VIKFKKKTGVCRGIRMRR